MSRWHLGTGLLLWLGTLAGCTGASSGSLGAVGEAGVADGGRRGLIEPTLSMHANLTAEKLERYVQFQRRLLETLSAEVEKAGESAPVGTPIAGSTTAGSAAIDGGRSGRYFSETRARQEGQVRAELGVTPEDVLEVESVAAPVLQKLRIARSPKAASALARWKVEVLRLPPGAAKTELEGAIAELEKQRDEGQALAEERQRYGSDPVQRVVDRYEDLNALEEARIELARRLRGQ